MNICILSWFDPAGGAGRLAFAINQTTDHWALAYSWSKRSWPWPCTSFPTRQEVGRAIRWADALIIIGTRHSVVKGQVDRDAMFPKGSPDRPTVVNYRGGLYLGNVDYFNQLDKEEGVVRSGNFCDLIAAGGLPHWLPNPIWVDDIAAYRDREEDDVFRVVHSVISRNRLELKGCPQTGDALTGLDGVEYEIITQIPYQAAMERVGKRADALVTGFEVGYGNSGIEAMCMGIPVIAWGPPEYQEEVRNRVGYLPFVASPPDGLRDVVDSLRRDEAMYGYYSQLGTEYAQDFHAPQVVAEKAIELCRLAGADD